MKLLVFCLSLGLCGLTFPVHAQVVKVACIGDSITEGAGVDTPTVNAYPVVLGRLLGSNFQARNFGVSGTTMLKKGDSPYWITTQYKSAQTFAPDIVTIKLGTNDSKPQNWKYKEQFAGDLRALIEQFAGLPSHPRIILCLPVPAYSITFDINPGIIKNEIIPIIRAMAQEKNLMVVDLYTALSGRPELFPDNIHPNAAGAAIIAKTLQGAVLASRP
jgi:acyl-CoA thioesterase I